jgi:hypothetical protein
MLIVSPDTALALGVQIDLCSALVAHFAISFRGMSLMQLFDRWYIGSYKLKLNWLPRLCRSVRVVSRRGGISLDIPLHRPACGNRDRFRDLVIETST